MKKLIFIFFQTIALNTIAADIDGRMGLVTLKIPLTAGKPPQGLITPTFVPPRTGQPSPMLIMNHSLNGISDNDDQVNAKKSPETHYYIAREFVARGYIVANPARQGRGGSDGARDKDVCDLAAHAQREAGDIAAIVRGAVKDPAIDKNNIIIAGQSHGAVLMLAMLTHYPEEAKHIKGAISFSGGVYFSSNECPWRRTKIIAAYQQYGKTIKIPTLWLYTNEDTLFKPDFYTDLHHAYTAAGGKAELVEVFKSGDHSLGGHSFSNWYTSVPAWSPHVIKYLSNIDAPTKILHTIAPRYKITPSGHANIDEVAKFPLAAQFEKQYKEFLTLPMPRTLVISLSDPVRFSTSADHMDSFSYAINVCRSSGGKNCQPYAVDDVVVYKAEHAKESGNFFK